MKSKCTPMMQGMSLIARGLLASRGIAAPTTAPRASLLATYGSIDTTRAEAVSKFVHHDELPNGSIAVLNVSENQIGLMGAQVRPHTCHIRIALAPDSIVCAAVKQMPLDEVLVQHPVDVFRAQGRTGCDDWP